MFRPERIANPGSRGLTSCRSHLRDGRRSAKVGRGLERRESRRGETRYARVRHPLRYGGNLTPRTGSARRCPNGCTSADPVLLLRGPSFVVSSAGLDRIGFVEANGARTPSDCLAMIRARRCANDGERGGHSRSPRPVAPVTPSGAGTARPGPVQRRKAGQGRDAAEVELRMCPHMPCGAGKVSGEALVRVESVLRRTSHRAAPLRDRGVALSLNPCACRRSR